MTGPTSLYVQIPILAAVATAAICATALQSRQVQLRRSDKDCSSDDQSNTANKVELNSYVTIETMGTDISLDDDERTTDELTTSREMESTDLANSTETSKSISEEKTQLDKREDVLLNGATRFSIMFMFLVAGFAVAVQVASNTTTISKPFITNLIDTTPVCQIEFHEWVETKSYGRIDLRNFIERTSLCKTENNKSNNQGKTQYKQGAKRVIRQILGGVQLSMDE